MTQYHSLKQHSSQATNSKSLVIPTSDMSLPTSATSLLAPPPALTPAFGINQAQKSQNLMIGAATNDLNEDCYNFVLQSVVYNCASPISNKLLVRPSIINAPVQLSAKNSSSSSSKISLPSISELDCMIDNTPRTGDQMMRAMDSTRHANKWFAPHPPPPPPPPPVISTTTSNSSSSNTSPVTQYRAAKSNNPQTNRQDVDRTINTNKRPLKRQKTLSNKLGSSGSSTTFPAKKQQQNQCHSCKSTETPEWRRGPLGPRTLCNACGLIWTKLCKQEEDDNSRRKLKNKHHHHCGSTSTITPPVMMEDSSSSSLGKTHQYGKLDLAFLLS